MMWGYGPGYGYGPGWMMGGGAFMIFIMALVVVGIVVAAVAVLRRERYIQGPYDHRPDPHSSGLAILADRYAKGEIQRDEYLQKKSDLAKS